MEKLLTKSHALLNLLKRSLPQGPIHKWVQQHPIARDLAASITGLLPSVLTVHAITVPATTPSKMKAVSWNIDRGKKVDSIVQLLQTHEHLANADIIFITEADWGMARSGNRNVILEIAQKLNMNAYFAPAYLNLTNGHGAERAMGGENQYGLHGNAILSKYPLHNLRAIPLKNATNKFKSKEVRLGQQTALLADLQVGDTAITVVCVHLDAYSSHKQRAGQLKVVLAAIPNNKPVLMGADLNTSTYDARHPFFTAMGLLYKALFFGPKKVMGTHYLHPYKRFDRPVFRVLEEVGLDYKNSNELGIGTFDIVLGDAAMEQMASDKFPKLIRRFAQWAVNLNGGGCSTKLDWFVTRDIQPMRAKVVRLTTATTDAIAVRLSDHHPIMLEFGV